MTTLTFTEKLGVLPDRVFEAMFNDRLVAKGTMLQMITEIFKVYIKMSSVDDLVALLSKAKVADRLLLYFPPGQQTEEAFKTHFENEGMHALVRPQAPACFVPVHFACRIGTGSTVPLYLLHVLVPCAPFHAEWSGVKAIGQWCRSTGS